MGPTKEFEPDEAQCAGSTFDAGVSPFGDSRGVDDDPGEAFVPSIDRELEAAFEYKLCTGGREAVGEILDIFAAVLRRRARGF